MLIVALVLAVIGLAALVTAVVTSNELVAWVCIGASALGVVLLIIDAIRDRKRRRIEAIVAASAATAGAATAVIVGSEAPTEVVAGLGSGEGGEEYDAEDYDEGSEDYDDDVEEYYGDDDAEGIDYGDDGEDEVSEDDLSDDEIRGEEPERAAIVDEVAEEEVEELVEDSDGDAGQDDLAREIDDEDHPEEIVHSEPEFDTYGDDEAEFPEPAEEAALHTVVIYESDATPSTEAAVIYSGDDPDSPELATSDEDGPS